jgi:polyisoprenoid-binding protein YceI
MEATTWNLDTAHSAISFSVRHMVFAKVRGRFATWSGAASLDTQDLTRSSVEVEIDSSSIDTGVGDRDKHLRSADFFDVQRFPTLRFASKQVEHVSGERYRIHGELTIRDVTRPIVLEAEYGGQAKDPWGNQRVAFTATASVNRSEFGLKWNQALEAGGVLVGERIDIELEVQAVQAAGVKAA